MIKCHGIQNVMGFRNGPVYFKFCDIQSYSNPMNSEISEPETLSHQKSLLYWCLCSKPINYVQQLLLPPKTSQKLTGLQILQLKNKRLNNLRRFSGVLVQYPFEVLLSCFDNR